MVNGIADKCPKKDVNWTYFVHEDWTLKIVLGCGLLSCKVDIIPGNHTYTYTGFMDPPSLGMVPILAL